MGCCHVSCHVISEGLPALIYGSQHRVAPPTLGATYLCVTDKCGIFMSRTLTWFIWGREGWNKETDLTHEDGLWMPQWCEGASVGFIFRLLDNFELIIPGTDNWGAVEHTDRAGQCQVWGVKTKKDLFALLASEILTATTSQGLKLLLKTQICSVSTPEITPTLLTAILWSWSTFEAHD